MKRILIVCHELKSCDEVLRRGVQIAKELNAGITVLFVHEVELFHLFGFEQEQEFDAKEITASLKEQLASFGVEDAAVLVKTGDSADLVEQEVLIEDDALVVMKYWDNLTIDILKRVKVSALVLKSFKPQPVTAATLATEVATPKSSVKLLHSLGITKINVFMDEQVVPVVPVVEPVADFTYSGIEEEVYVQQLQQTKEGLQDFCKQRDLECTIGMEDESLSVNIVAFASEKGADLLALGLRDGGSILAASVGDIVQKATIDILLSYENE